MVLLSTRSFAYHNQAFKATEYNPADAAAELKAQLYHQAEAGGLCLQVKQGQEVFNHGQASEQISDADSLQYSMGAEGDKEAAYQYSDTSMPTQDGGPQWSIGGVPLQQQLRCAM